MLPKDIGVGTYGENIARVWIGSAQAMQVFDQEGNFHTVKLLLSDDIWYNYMMYNIYATII